MPKETLQGLFKGTQLRRVRRALGLSESEVASELGMSVSDVASWEDGNEVPSFVQFQALSKFFGLPEVFFLRETPAIPLQASFRSQTALRPAEMSPATRKVLVQFTELCRYQAQLERMLDTVPQIPLPQVAGIADPEREAESVRIQLGLDSQPIGDLDSLMHAEGIKVFYLDVPGKEFAGLSLVSSEFGHAIWVDATDAYVRQRFTVCHEYAHLLWDRRMTNIPTACDLDWNTEPERAFNRFAAAFLVPAKSSELWRFSEEHPSPGPEDLDSLIHIYGLSREAIARRLVELEMCGHDLVSRVLAAGLPEPPPGHPVRRRPGWRKTRGKRFLSLTRTAYKKGMISLGKLAEYLGTDPETALEFVEGKTKG